MSRSVGVQTAIAPHAEGVRSYRLDAAICVFALALIVLVWGGAVAITQRERADAIASVIKSNANIARVVEEHTIRALEGADQTLRLVKREYEQRGANFDLPLLYERLQLDRSFHVNSVIADSAGDIVASSTREYAPANLADREHFKVHGAADTDKPFISKPILARVSQRWTIVLTRRLNRQDGSFGGIAAISMEPFYFTSLYQQIDLGEKGIIALTGLDGIMRARLDTGKGNLGQDVSKSEVFRHIQKSPNGSYVAASAVDGRLRIFSYRVVRGYPLLVNVGVAESVALAPVMARQRGYFIMAASLSTLLFLGAGLLISAAHRRRSYAHALADGERRLETSRQLFIQQQSALTELARDELLSRGELQPVFEKITATIVSVMGVARASIWRFDSGHVVLRCCDLFTSTAGHAAGAELKVEDFPAYFAALECGEIIDADDAHSDPRTREFSASYLTPMGITSMLDIPVFVEGKLDGVICCEHTGAPLRWIPEQRLFGTALANLLEIAEGHAERRRAAAALRESEETLRAAFEQAAVGIGLYHLRAPTPGWTRVNHKLSGMLGYSIEELLRLSVDDITPPEDRAESRAVLRNITQGNIRAFNRERRYLRKDGNIIWARVSGATVAAPDGQPLHAVIVAEDITERRQAESALAESEQRLRALLDGLPDRVYLKDVQGRYVAINRGTEEALGLPAESIIGKTDMQLISHTESALIEEEERQLMASRQTLRVERKSRLTHTWAEVVKAPIIGRDGEVAGLVGISRDITERRALEKDRRAHDLAQRGALVREIHHRIKNHIQGVAGLLQGHARRQPALESAIQSAVAQLRSVAVIHGLQDASGGGVRLHEMIAAICESVRGYAADKVTFNVVGKTGAFWIDEDEAVPLALIVNELLMNAIKHGPFSDTFRLVEVEIDAADEGARLQIRNRGSLSRQVEAASPESGHGLGIVRSLLPARGATLDLSQCGDQVCATLMLQAPVVVLETPPAHAPASNESIGL